MYKGGGAHLLKKYIIYLALLCTLVLTVPIHVHAASAVVGDRDDADSDTDSSESGGGSSGGEEGSGYSGPPSPPRTPKEITISPTATALHSLNALFAAELDGKDLGVYFVPALEDFPTNLSDTAAYIVDTNGQEHRFAAVYDGYFNTEVTYVQATNTDGDTGSVGRLQTSKKVYSTVDNTRTLNLIGYDLLLAEEKTVIHSSGGTVSADYIPTLVGTSNLSAQTVVMDLYKAIGQFEWDIKFVWVKDEDFLLENSPVQNLFGVTINDKFDYGIDNNEGATYVWATRTNPELYWKRAQKDAIFDGGAHSVTNTKTTAYVGSDVSVTFSKAQGDTVTFGQFCAIARAMMDLYGEPVMTAKEQLVMIQNYGLSLPSCADKEIYDSVCYLAAKGIINPDDVDLGKQVTFADIEPVLVRIADEKSRLTFKETSYNPNSELFRRGYVATKTTLSDGLIEEVEQVNSDISTRYNDYFVECDDDLTNFILTDGNGEEILASDHILCNDVASASTDYWYSPDATIDELYPFEFVGIEDNFYHFKIADEVDSVTISYERDLARSNYELNHDSYELPNTDGGVYVVEDGAFVHYSFDEAPNQTYTTLIDGDLVTRALPEYSLAYIDRERRGNGEITAMADFGYMSTYNWIYMTLDDAGKNSLHQYKYDGVSLAPLMALSDGSVTTLESPSTGGRIYVKYLSTTSHSHTYVFQVPYSLNEFRKYLQGVNNAEFADTNAYFCPDDDSVLVSYDFLRSKGLVSSMSRLSGDKGIVLTLSNMSNTNVVLRKDIGVIIVGNTLYKTDELLYYEAAEVLYINYRACLGWTYDYLVLNNGSSIQLTAKNKLGAVNRSSLSLSTMFPTSSIGVPGIVFSGETYIPLSGMNPLGNYLLVVDPYASNTDYLFMWKRKEFALPGNSSVNSYSDDDSAKRKFEELTGIPIDASDDYVLMMTSLYHNNYTTNLGDFIYITRSTYGAGGAVGKDTVGWVYKPHLASTWNEAATEYLNTSSAAMLPIAKVGAKYVNLNINTCSVTPIDDPLPYGQMPLKYVKRIVDISSPGMDSAASMVTNGAITGSTSSVGDDKNKICKISDATNIIKYDEVSATYDSLDDVTINPAPVGMFGDVYELPSANLGQVANKSKAIYYGSQLLSVARIDGSFKLVLGPNKCLVSDDSGEYVQAITLGSGTNALYSFSKESRGVNMLLQNSLDSVSAVITDANKLIDWDQFKFRRLVKRLDEWSSILLIFALNVLPRVGMCLFMVFIILTTVKDWRPWKRFCREKFDIYRVLSAGHVTVDSANTGRIVFYSMIALAVFAMMIDGLLFEFMLWVAKFIFVFQQN